MSRQVRALFERYREAFSEGYREAYSPAIAVDDIRMIEGLGEQRPLSVDFHHRLREEPQCVGLKVWSLARRSRCRSACRCWKTWASGWSTSAPTRSRRTGEAEREVWLHDMLLERADGGDRSRCRQGALEAAFLMVMRGGAENDGYNALVLAGGLAWRDVALIRTISRFLRQIRVPYSQDYMWATLRKHAAIAGEMVALFHARFDPRLEAATSTRTREAEEVAAEIEEALAEGREPRRGPHPAPLRQRGAVGDPHQFLSDRAATASRSR